MAVELLQFRFSPYNEKVRWALDLKRVSHTRRSLLPGPHFPVVKRLTGQTATPVLVVDGMATAGSARILGELERRWSDPSLYPADQQMREEALAIEQRFDRELTPRCRRALLSAMLTDLGYVARVFGGGTAYRWSLPLVQGLIRKGNGITGLAAVEDGKRANREALDYVAEKTAATGYLVGPSFTVADLTAASLLATLTRIEHPDMARPQPAPAELAQLLDEVSYHPAIAWTKRMYERHRPATMAIA